QASGRVLGRARACDEPRRDERPSDEKPQDEIGGGPLLVVRRQDERDPDAADGERPGPVREPEAWQPGHCNNAAMAGPDSSAFGTNPRAPDCSTSGPKSAASRLEVRITAGEPPFIVASRLATSKPSKSGSWTSSRTTSGRSSCAARTAESPSSASPTTSKPSAWSSTRAV